MKTDQSGKKIVITGGSGFKGSWLCRMLIKKCCYLFTARKLFIVSKNNV